MRQDAFDTLEISEGSWWDSGRQAAIRAVLRGSFKHILDYGAGFGSQSRFLKTFGDEVSAYEPEANLQDELSTRGYAHVYRTPGEVFSHSFDLVALLDVIEHIEDDQQILKQVFGALRPGGTVIVTVPAYQWLWSKHDVKNMHFRRYSAASLRAVLERAGFSVTYIGYWNMTLLAPLCVIRFFGGTGAGGFELPRFFNTLVSALLRGEAFLMQYCRLPFGISLIARAQKP